MNTNFLNPFKNFNETELHIKKLLEVAISRYGCEHKEVYRKALKEYREFEGKLQKMSSLSFEQLCKNVNGYNVDNTSFDTNYNSLAITVEEIDGERYVSENIEVYHDDITWDYESLTLEELIQKAS